ncbi:MAG: 4Fe-4S binding protein [Xanthomonadales bacterium]|nr:4Fe-4S binding protein [Xanthomonadales bacterium]
MINPGFLLFALALLVTALFGRLFCGWACHMAALRDLCAWLLQRIGIRPRLFRSRLLGYVPLLLALYLFVWPSVERSIVVPLLARVWPSALAGFDPPPPISGWSLQWTSNNLWAGMPELWVAVPFLLICGSATVYFLGARGLCRYGCPYGGFLRPVEQLAPLRIVVDPDRCDHCALCSAACSLQIRVHEQTRAHGAVLDADCMRTLDCIDACPHQALSLRVATPPLWREAQPAATYDLRLRDEWLIALVAPADPARHPRSVRAHPVAACGDAGGDRRIPDLAGAATGAAAGVALPATGAATGRAAERGGPRRRRCAAAARVVARHQSPRSRDPLARGADRCAGDRGIQALAAGIDPRAACAGRCRHALVSAGATARRGWPGARDHARGAVAPGLAGTGARRLHCQPRRGSRVSGNGCPTMPVVREAAELAAEWLRTAPALEADHEHGSGDRGGLLLKLAGVPLPVRRVRWGPLAGATLTTRRHEAHPAYPSRAYP